MFRTQGTLEVGFLSNLQVAGWLVEAITPDVYL